MKARAVKIHGVTVAKRWAWSAAHKSRVTEMLAPAEEPRAKAECKARTEARALQYAKWLLARRGETAPDEEIVICYEWEAIREWTKLCTPIAGRPWQCPPLDPTAPWGQGPFSRFRRQHQAEERIRAVAFHTRGDWIRISGWNDGYWATGELLLRVEIPHWDWEPVLREEIAA